eukprot:CAMPEP_0170436020 /NCGR_PEP_ID=MMETSP0117_2-20130122/43917_1 /TAXON_ID=400756 /ORGANISM="Durinskia baltica, Strain CSIRO CS-38" /LENGTH=34 /DNA_ID= /DNA_START= /DNA_END= /DNA_ORIENTATION=
MTAPAPSTTLQSRRRQRSAIFDEPAPLPRAQRRK